MVKYRIWWWNDKKGIFKGIRYPYITNASPNKRHDGINIARAAYAAVDPSVLETEINEKNNPVFKLESLSRMQGLIQVMLIAH